METQCQKNIFDNRHEWFGTDWVNDINDLTDIDNYFRNIIKPFKGGKFHSISVSIPNDLKIYDENENEIQSDKIIGEQTNILCILEFEGIKCNLSNFQIQIKVRQMMMIQPLFSKCLIKKTSNQSSVTTNPATMNPVTTNHPATVTTNTTTNNLGNKTYPPFSDSKINELQLEEMKLNIEETDDTVELKDRKTIIMELYKNAKDKAKKARHLALMAYLEKNEIKNTYMLQDIESDDEDNDELYGY